MRFPTHKELIAQIGTPEGWQQEIPGRPDGASHKIRHSDPFYLAVTVGHPVEYLLEDAHYRNYADPGALLNELGEEELIRLYKDLNEDTRAPFTHVAVDTTRLGGAPSMHFHQMMILQEPNYEITSHVYYLRVQEGWVYLACGYETSYDAIAFARFKEVLSRLELM